MKKGGKKTTSKKTQAPSVTVQYRTIVSLLLILIIAVFALTAVLLQERNSLNKQEILQEMSNMLERQDANHGTR